MSNSNDQDCQCGWSGRIDDAIVPHFDSVVIVFSPDFPKI